MVAGTLRTLFFVGVVACTHEHRPVRTSPNAASTLPAQHVLACVAKLERAEWPAFTRDCVTPDIAADEMDGVTTTGTDALAAQIDALRSAFPDLHIGVETVLVGDHDIFLVARITGTQHGTLHAPVGDIPPSGRAFGIPALVQLAVDDTGRTMHASVYLDPLTVLGQLGALPEGAPQPRAPLPPFSATPVIVTRANSATEQANTDTVRRFTDAVNAHRAADVLALVADSIVDSDPGLPQDLAGHAVRDMYEGILHDIADYHRDVATLYAIGNYVVAPGIKTGTWGTAKVKLHYAEVIRLDRARVAENRRFYNVWQMANQITSASQ